MPLFPKKYLWSSWSRLSLRDTCFLHWRLKSFWQYATLWVNSKVDWHWSWWMFASNTNLKDRQQYVRVDNTSSRIVDITSGLPKGSLLGALLFSMFNNDLPDVLVFSELFIFAEDLKILAVQRSYWEIQDDLHAFENWVIQNKMELAIDKYVYLKFRGMDQQYKLMREVLAKTRATAKDLGIHMAADVSWKQHTEEEWRKQIKFLHA